MKVLEDRCEYDRIMIFGNDYDYDYDYDLYSVLSICI